MLSGPGVGTVLKTVRVSENKFCTLAARTYGSERIRRIELPTCLVYLSVKDATSLSTLSDHDDIPTVVVGI